MSGLDWPQRLSLVRHGQSAGNVARDAAEAAGLELIDIATRDADTPLSELGERQAAALGAWFAGRPESERPDCVFTSPFVRSQQTCRAISDAIGIPVAKVRVDERLREKEFGILDRFTKHGIEQKFPELAAQRALVGKFYFRPPGGESWCDVVLRLRSVIEVLRRDSAQRRVLVVSHQVIVNCFRYLLEDLDEARILALDRGADVPNCGLTEYTASADGAQMVLVGANMTHPLESMATPVTVSKDQPAGPK